MYTAGVLLDPCTRGGDAKTCRHENTIPAEFRTATFVQNIHYRAVHKDQGLRGGQTVGRDGSISDDLKFDPYIIEFLIEHILLYIISRC